MQGLGAGLGGRVGEGGPQGGADYLLISQVVNAEEHVLLPGAFFS